MQKGFTIIEVMILVVVLFVGGAFIKNIANFCSCNFEAPYKAEVLYGAGIFTPTFLVTAFMDIED